MHSYLPSLYRSSIVLQLSIHTNTQLPTFFIHFLHIPPAFHMYKYTVTYLLYTDPPYPSSFPYVQIHSYLPSLYRSSISLQLSICTNTQLPTFFIHFLHIPPAFHMYKYTATYLLYTDPPYPSSFP